MNRREQSDAQQMMINGDNEERVINTVEMNELDQSMIKQREVEDIDIQMDDQIDEITQLRQ